MTTRFKQLPPEERVTLASLWQQNVKLRQIARLMKRSPSTISRQLSRNGGPDGEYASATAEEACRARRAGSRPPR